MLAAESGASLSASLSRADGRPARRSSPSASPLLSSKGATGCARSRRASTACSTAGAPPAAALAVRVTRAIKLLDLYGDDVFVAAVTNVVERELSDIGARSRWPARSIARIACCKWSRTSSATPSGTAMVTCALRARSRRFGRARGAERWLADPARHNGEPVRAVPPGR